MLLAGIDEAGRGPIIGPMVICGVALDEHKVNYLRDLQVKDSKLLTPAKRERIFRELTTVGTHYIIIVSPAEIDAAVMGVDGLNLNWLEAKKSVEILEKLQPQRAYVDCPSPNLPAYTNFMLKYLTFPMDLLCEHKADAKYEIVSAASIIAKVTRDRLIEEIKKKHGVDFGSGYIADPKTAAFVKEHPEFPEIRKSWAPYKKIMTERKQKGIKEF
jgi:ribonuclease HII